MRDSSKTPAGGVPHTGSLSDTGATAGVPHPFAGLLSRSKVCQVALRESRQPTEVCATSARNGTKSKCGGVSDIWSFSAIKNFGGVRYLVQLRPPF